MKISIIGGGAWGTTLAQALSDNEHEILIRDVNAMFVERINNSHTHPFFSSTIPASIKATLDITEAVNYSDVIVLSVPTKVTRSVLEEINSIATSPKLFINVSKGIEPDTSYCVSQIVEEVMDADKLKGYVILSGPSHADRKSVV